MNPIYNYNASNFSSITSQEKNMLARNILERLIRNIVWMNTYNLPGDVLVFEIRNELGYGARWNKDGTVSEMVKTLLYNS